MHHGALSDLGIFAASVEIGYIRSRSFDDMCEDWDNAAAAATNAILSDMNNGERMLREAIETFYLGHVWLRPLNLTYLVELGKEKVGERLERRGFV